MPETLTAIVVEQQRQFDAATSACDRKERGHFGTPPEIASFMAGMFSEFGAGTVRVLDPGAGVGALSAAVCQRVLSRVTPQRLEFELWENDPRLEPHLRRTMDKCWSLLGEAGHWMDYTIVQDDFILANRRTNLFAEGPSPSFHRAILNPPYFKVRKESAHAQAMEHVVHGQPNIYALFMAVAADLLLPGGEIVAITPRSYFSGPYFKRFRKWFFDRMAARRIHVFESRAAAFAADNVLQENVILLAEKGGEPAEVALTASSGADFAGTVERRRPYRALIEDSSGDHLVRVTSSQTDQDLVEALDALPFRFRDLGLEISTGPVVTFRATRFLQYEQADNTAPLLWMHNVRPFVTRFPPANAKPNHILNSAASRRLLVPARRYVLLKRFTAKEERRRLVAGIVQPTDCYSEWLGLENHLNYVHRGNAELREDEAYGLAAYFNSELLDRYFRTISGNTQVNAAEIRALPMPSAVTLSKIGAEVLRQGVGDRAAFERLIGRAVGLPEQVIVALGGADA